MSKPLSVDIFLGDRFYHTMKLQMSSVPILMGGRFVEKVSLEDATSEVCRRIPFLRNRSDLRIMFN